MAITPDEIKEWEHLFKLETGFTKLPTTIVKPRLHLIKSEYQPGDEVITIGGWGSVKNALYKAFIWFHEAYHYVQDIEGMDHEEDDLIRACVEPDRYCYITSELEANKFALKMCKKYNIPFLLPHYLPKDYINLINEPVC